ncbi:DinB family protein [Kribbella sp. NPDC023855]|uniref:DinB family protein n=1 Tax=Kribbella sp. NPDC023855 TaxID=3154698 RepID=UPI0033D982F9
MTSFTQSDDLEGAEFIDVNARGARFTRSDLSGTVMRAVEINGADIDAPWLLEPDNVLLVNGVNVVPLVDAELNRRFPGRSQRKAATPAGLRDAWATLEETWAATLDRVRAMPAGTADRSVDGEWSFAQTLRHLVMATDTWLGGALKGLDQPFHPIGQPNIEYETDGHDMTVFATTQPGFDEVLAVRAERMTMVRNYLARITEDELASPRQNPWAPQYPETVLSCLHTILEEEWEHHRYATRDLNTL